MLKMLQNLKKMLENLKKMLEMLQNLKIRLENLTKMLQIHIYNPKLSLPQEDQEVADARSFQQESKRLDQAGTEQRKGNVYYSDLLGPMRGNLVVIFICQAFGRIPQS